MTARRSILAALTVTLFLPFSICSSKLRDLRLQQAVDRGLDGSAGIIPVVDVESAEILAAKNLEFASKQFIRPGSTLKPFVLMELLDSARLDPNERLIGRRPLRIGGMRLDCSHTAEVSELDADDAIAYSSNSYVAKVALRMSGDALTEAPHSSSSEAIGIAVAIVVLLITFGSLIAAGLPILTAIIGVGIGI